jgi:hypothetical protein
MKFLITLNLLLIMVGCDEDKKNKKTDANATSGQNVTAQSQPQEAQKSEIDELRKRLEELAAQAAKSEESKTDLEAQLLALTKSVQGLQQVTTDNVSMGVLAITSDSTQYIRGGYVLYLLHESGVVFYTGEVTYNIPGLFSFAYTENLMGTYRAKPETVSSSSYRDVTSQQVENKVTLTTTNADDPARVVVHAEVTDTNKVDSTDAFGELTIDTTKELIKLMSADINGTIFEGKFYEINIRLHLQAPE